MNSQTDISTALWEANLGPLRHRFPDIAAVVEQPGLREQIATFKAKDGAIAYGIRKNGQVQPVTNPVNPLERINQQLKQWTDKLQDFTRPVLILGVHPGLEVLHIFNLQEQAQGNLCRQPIWICIDSIPAFCGFLQTYDATTLLNSDRVELFAHTDMPTRVEWLRSNPQFPYLFSMISLSPPQVQQAVLAPLAQLIQERSQQIKTLQTENAAYYNALTDEQLAGIIAGKADRKPRLMVPTCPWSTVIQYSIRDTCAAFERAGWETITLNSPAMLTPHYAMDSIHRFKPDLFLYVNHLRQEVCGIIPDNLLMVSWIQDPLPHVNNPTAAQQWNELAAQRNRDLIIGYTEQLKPYGYCETRLHPIEMTVNPELFRPRELTEEQKEKYGCDVCFASNCGLPTDRLIKEKLTGLLDAQGINERQLMEFHDQLWALYRSGETITDYQQLIEFLELNFPPESEVVQLLFWRLNDIIYRHVVIEWLDEYAQDHPDFKLHLYGQGWDQHPRFAKYATGVLEHGEKLSIAYQTAHFSLHLSAIEGPHQRITETINSGGILLGRLNSRLLKELPDSQDLTQDADELPLILHAICNWTPAGLCPPSPAGYLPITLAKHTNQSHLFDSKEKLFTLLNQRFEPVSTLPTHAESSIPIRTAVLQLLSGAHQREVSLPNPEKHSAAYCTAHAAIARYQGDLSAFDRVLPREAPSKGKLRFTYAMECCFTGRLDQSLNLLEQLPPDPEVALRSAQLNLLLGRYGACLAFTESGKRFDMIRTLAGFFAEGRCELPDNPYWQAVVCREQGLPADFSRDHPWLNKYGSAEQLFTQFVDGVPLSLKSPQQLAQLTFCFLQKEIDAALCTQSVQVLSSSLQFGISATHPLFILIASAAVTDTNPGWSKMLLTKWLPRFPVSHSMFRPNGLHSAFTQRLTARLSEVFPSFKGVDMS